MIKRLLSDLRKWSELDRETSLDQEVTQEMCERYIKTVDYALEVLKEYDEDKYYWYDSNGTIGNEIELFTEAIECVLDRLIGKAE